VAIVIAVFEFTWKQRKLAVDENVSRLCSHFLVTKPDRCAPPPQLLHNFSSLFLKALTLTRPSAVAIIVVNYKKMRASHCGCVVVQDR
jgi:hypothetical protein